jgi:polyisoprenoid-binding protein YceI
LLTGNLTIMDITKSITFKANVSVSDANISVKSEDFAVNRTDWNLTYNTEGTAGVPVDYLIANDVGFTIDVTLNK